MWSAEGELLFSAKGLARFGLYVPRERGDDVRTDVPVEGEHTKRVADAVELVGLGATATKDSWPEERVCYALAWCL